MGGAILSTGRKNYCTPSSIVEPIRSFFLALNGRGITLDPCSNPKSLVMAEKNIMLESSIFDLQEAAYTVSVELVNRGLEKQLFNICDPPEKLPAPWPMSFITGDGLATSWQGENTYFNPPFGYNKHTQIGIKTWINKAIKESELGKLRSVAEDRNVNTEIIACIPDTPETVSWKMGVLLKAQGRCQLGKRVKFMGMAQGIPKPISLIYFGSNPELFKQVFKHIGRVENPSVVYADQAEINPTF
jgi:hypothetical protein